MKNKKNTEGKFKQSTSAVPSQLVAPVFVPATKSARDVCGEGTGPYKLNSPVVKWKSIPVKVWIDYSNNKVSDAEFGTEVLKAFDEFKYHYGADFFKASSKAEAQITIGWRQEDGKGQTVAITRYSWGSGGWLKHADIDLDTSEAWAVMQQEVCGTSGKAYDVLNALIHEMLHAIGFDHNKDRFSSVYPFVTFGETLRRTLGAADVEGFIDLYGQVQPPVPAPINIPPTAQNLQFEMPQNTSMTVQLIGKDPEAGHLTYTLFTVPQYGVIDRSLIATALVTYHPNKDWYGIDSFQYYATDNNGIKSKPATVTIKVKQMTSPPSENKAIVMEVVKMLDQVVTKLQEIK